jgi:hypothetical protein
MPKREPHVGQIFTEVFSADPDAPFTPGMVAERAQAMSYANATVGPG